MKNIIIAFIFIGIFISCNSSEKTKTGIQESSVHQDLSKNTAQKINKELLPIATDNALIATALMAAPEESRAGCKVIGYNMAGEFVTLKEGDNEFIVLADNPNQEGFNAACYHKDLEPFMARGRALKAEGKTGQETFAIREVEMKAGKLKITPGATLHVYYGAKTLYNPTTSIVKGAQLRYVVYMPWATSASTGLPSSPLASNHPWIMDPGTHRAHIMISPLAEDKK
ncbi:MULTISPECIES: hypothetical protein [unclassified Polaribacter]|uniref:hypothetical protein n=1 Tax=unclassified Polaribacter TaxID=196858 RepID=UPI0011BE180C|nr:MULTISPECIES: hypothetical protein [unclassified Polaribacter]TXD50444.1 hypothetical protein ES043_15950 [Polaribacter sp. IC063]TXD57087.1 hypothetical protein ES044_15855 [Polaribacter sp. IC066]